MNKINRLTLKIKFSFHINFSDLPLVIEKKQIMKNLLIPFVISPLLSVAQSDSLIIRNIFNEALSNGKSYEMLDYLTNKIGSRLSGSEGAAKSVEWAKMQMDELGFDKVYLQEVMVPKWVRGKEEVARITQTDGTVTKVNVCALGNSVGTGASGISGRIVEVQDFETLANLGRENVVGKIVYFSRPMDSKHIETFRAYGGAVNQRGSGPAEAAKLGAIGTIVRSMTLAFDDHPHTGSTNYGEGENKIPAIAISTMDGEHLSKLLKEDPELSFYFETHCEMQEEVLSFNVIGEITGKELPAEVIVVGGHLDSWDLGTGAHDDGAGCVQSIEVIRVIKSLGINNKRTIRAVMFMNEENGLRGGRKYAEDVIAKNEKHIAAIESDRGGFTPRGFGMTGTPEQLIKFQSWAELFAPYMISEFVAGGGGADIGPLRPTGTPLIGYIPDSQRYFDFHHSELDVFGGVNKRELEMGAAAMAALVYLIDKHGL